MRHHHPTMHTPRCRRKTHLALRSILQLLQPLARWCISKQSLLATHVCGVLHPTSFPTHCQNVDSPSQRLLPPKPLHHSLYDTPRATSLVPLPGSQRHMVTLPIPTSPTQTVPRWRVTSLSLHWIRCTAQCSHAIAHVAPLLCTTHLIITPRNESTTKSCAARLSSSTPPKHG